MKDHRRLKLHVCRFSRSPDEAGAVEHCCSVRNFGMDYGDYHGGSNGDDKATTMRTASAIPYSAALNCSGLGLRLPIQKNN